jgi:GMP synthase-like glutamine amidotransferase
MRIAILMTNTDESPFAHAWPLDGEKFSRMVGAVRPDWMFDVFSVKDGVFPDALEAYDGIIITGSPASVNDPDPWVGRLMGLIRNAHASGIAMFGACFGHQAIAKALGGEVGYNPNGWSYGYIETKLINRPDWMQGGADVIGQYSAHKEQVTSLPEGARIISETPGCPVGGFVIGDTVYTTQYHPEITPAFMAGLVEYFEDEIGKEPSDMARASLVKTADNQRVPQWVAAFFEQAAS